jgi:hypothetical protein
MSYNDSNHRFTPPPEWHTPTTGWHQADAGAGRHVPERVRRGGRASPGFQPLPLPNVQSPLSGLNDASAFVNEYAMDQHIDVAREMIVNGVLGYLLVRSWRQRDKYRARA